MPCCASAATSSPPPARTRARLLGMSRLDSMIRRLMIQRASLDWAMTRIAALPGPVLEFGLGNGRSYDHLREHLPNREIYVFDRHVAAHPDCIPPADRMILGDFTETAPAARRRPHAPLGRAAGQGWADRGRSADPVRRARTAPPPRRRPRPLLHQP